MDRNREIYGIAYSAVMSLSARRAWIEISASQSRSGNNLKSLSARRAWIEISITAIGMPIGCVALRKESVDRNLTSVVSSAGTTGRSPQGERG